MTTKLHVEENCPPALEKIISLFGTVVFDPGYYYKTQRIRHKYNGRHINKAGNQVNQVLLK